MQTDFDVIVVGGGGSGLACAVSAAEGGASVLLLEKQAELGGSTGIAVGSLTANQTSLQKKASIQDSLDAHAEDAAKFAPEEIEKRNNKDLRRWFLSHSSDTLDWLMSMGLQFYGPNPEPPNRCSRMHNVIPGAKAYITVLHARLMRLGGKVITDAAVTQLTQKVSRISGVIAEINGKPLEFKALKGVVLAAGDYANAPSIIGRFKGDQFSDIEGINPHSGGDGHLLAEDAGADLVNMDITYGPELRFIPPTTKTFQQLLPAQGPITRVMGIVVPLIPSFLMNAMIRRLLVTWQHPENALFDDGAILINKNAERFCDETKSPEREIAIANQPGKYCYILLDQRLIERYSRWPHFISTAPKIAYAYMEDYLKLRPDIAVKAESLSQLAKKSGLPENAVEENVLEENVLEKTITDSNAQKQAQGLSTLDTTGPWALMGPAKAYFTTTEGGAAINKNFEVLDSSGNPIPGLYAIGQNGLGGMILWGHGLHICWAITSGRLAGRLLANLANGN